MKKFVNQNDNCIWKQPIIVMLVAILCCALWGSAFPAIKMGYQTVILPKLRQSSKGKAEEWQSKIRLIEVTNIKELLSLL